MANDFQNQVSSRGSSGGNNVNGSGTSEISDILKGIGFDFNTYIKDQRDSLAKMAGMQQKFLEVMSKNEEIANLKNIQKKLEAENLSNEQRIELETKRQQILDRMVMESYNTVHQYRENLDNRYNKSRSMKERATLARQSSIELEVHKVAIRKKYNEELKAAAGNSVKQKEILEKQADELRTINEEQAIADDQSKKYNRINKALKFTGMQSSDEREQERKEQQARRSSRLNEINEELEEIALSYDSLTDEEKRNAEQRESQLKEERTHLEALSEKETELSKKREENFVKLENSVNQAYEKMFTLLTENVGKVNARLQGSGLTWESTTDLITTNLSINPFVKTENVINKLVEATNLGIAYNLEQRAFLATISEKIASTFNAFDSNLLRLIKLQQADSTAARLGIESSLTKFLNSMYEDTSYLSDLSSSVAGAIIDANAQLGRNASAEFEYTVQKWLGSLSSLGMSSNTVTNIAQGLNYLATGDVTSLSSNTSLQTLFAMSANRAGLSYASLLTNGLNASDTNKLLQSMVEYLKEIAENADNQVVKGAYGNILGMSLSDFRSITNLTSSDIQTIAGNQLTYENLINEVNNQLSFSNLMSRSNISEMLNTAYSNALLGVASDFTSNPALYAMRQTLMFLAGEGTDINIPFVNAAGFGLDLNTTVGDLARMGLGITQGLGLVVNILQGLSASGGLDLGSWNARETTRRGNIGNLLSTVIGGTSTSTYVSNTNQSDMTNQTLSRAVDDSEETKKITNKNTQDDAKSAENAYEALTSASSKHGNGNEFFWVKDALLAAVYDTSNGGSIRTIDRNLSNLFTTVFGNQSVVGKGFVKSLMFTDGTIPVDVRNNYIKVAISSADSVPISIKATDALPVIIRSSDTTFKIAAESLNSLKQNSAPQTVTIASTSSAITINSKDIENGVKAAILALIGSESEDDRLSRFLDNASDDTKGIPIKVSSTPTTNNLNVIVKNSGTEKIPITSR